jgi:hypothetical protein
LTNYREKLGKQASGSFDQLHRKPCYSTLYTDNPALLPVTHSDTFYPEQELAVLDSRRAGRAMDKVRERG